MTIIFENPLFEERNSLSLGKKTSQSEAKILVELMTDGPVVEEMMGDDARFYTRETDQQKLWGIARSINSKFPHLDAGVDGNDIVVKRREGHEPSRDYPGMEWSTSSKEKLGKIHRIGETVRWFNPRVHKAYPVELIGETERGFLAIYADGGDPFWTGGNFEVFEKDFVTASKEAQLLDPELYEESKDEMLSFLHANATEDEITRYFGAKGIPPEVQKQMIQELVLDGEVQVTPGQISTIDPDEAYADTYFEPLGRLFNRKIAIQELEDWQATEYNGKYSSFASDLGWSAGARWPEQILFKGITLRRQHLPQTENMYTDVYVYSDLYKSDDGKIELTVFND